MTLNSIRNALCAAMHGMTPEEYELQKARDNLKTLTDEFLDQHPEYLRGRFSEGKPAPVDASTKRIKKSLGADAGTFTPHIIDEGALERARVQCREVVASDPDRYSHII